MRSTGAVRLVTCLSSLAAVLAAQGPPASQDPQAQRGPMLLPQAIVMPRGDAEIAIDGTLSDWPSLPAIVLSDPRQLSGTAFGAWNGERDCRAMAFLMWDETHLYFSAQVQDDWHRGLDAATLQVSEIPVADSIVLTFDPDRNTRSSGPDRGREEDREFWLADEPSRQVVLWDRLRGTARVLEAAAARSVCLHDKEQGVTTYEAMLPWSEILPPGRKPENGLVVDLQVVVNDFDESTDAMPQTRIGWTFGCGPVVDPGLLGSMMLVGDRSALQGHVPEFPPKPPAGSEPLGSKEEWHDLTAALLRSPPAIHDGSVSPEQVGGLDRLHVLEAIDQHCDRYPRVDFVEFTSRIQRRMTREVAGIRARGLPYWWSKRLEGTSKAAEDPVAVGTVRVFRIPMGGWLFATPGGGFVVDAAGADVVEWLWGRSQFAILTQPLDPVRRNDQMLLRMLLGKPPRAVLTHIAFHLPVIPMGEMPLVQPGSDCGPPRGLAIKAIARQLADGSVPASCSYSIGVHEGPSILVVAPSLQIEETPEGPVDLLLASPHNPDLIAIVEKAKPRLVLLDDVFQCQSLPAVPRLQLRNLHALQKALQPWHSLLLAPGESWDVTRG